MLGNGEWWLEPQNMPQGKFLHPREHKNSSFQMPLMQVGVLIKIKNHTGLWSHPEWHLHINLLEMKAVLLALQFFKMYCKNNQVLITSENTSVMTYIKTQGGVRSVVLCALLWRILTWCHKDNVTLRSRHIPVSLNVITNCLFQEDCLFVF